MLTREDVFKYIAQKYDAKPEYLWKKYPSYAVLRHANEGKWFVLVMDVSGSNLGLDAETTETIMDVKLSPEEVETLQNSKGFLPAYHMNKTHWISARLSLVSEKEIYNLIDTSYQNTK